MFEELLDDAFDVLLKDMEKKLETLGDELVENYQVPNEYNIYKKKLFSILDDNRGNFSSKALVYSLLSMPEESQLYKIINSIFFNFQNLIEVKRIQVNFLKKVTEIDKLSIEQDIYKEKVFLLKYIEECSSKSEYILEYISIYILKKLFFVENHNLILQVKGITEYMDFDEYSLFNFEQFKNSLNNINEKVLINYNNFKRQIDFDKYLDNVFELKFEISSFNYKNFIFNINGEPYDINEFFSNTKRKSISLNVINEVFEELFYSKEVTYSQFKEAYNKISEEGSNKNAFYDLYPKSIKPLLKELIDNFNKKEFGISIEFNEEEKVLRLREDGK